MANLRLAGSENDYNPMKLLFVLWMSLLGYALPVLGTFISTRLFARHWWPTLPELQLIILPIVFYAVLSTISDRQGYSIGLPSLLIAIPVMITLWLGTTEYDVWVPFKHNLNYWLGFGASLLTALLVYAFYPETGLGY